MKRMMSRTFCLGLVFALILQVIPSGSARGQQAAALSDEQVTERLAFIESALEAGRPRAETWYYGWLGAYSVGSLACGIVAGTNWANTKIVDGQAVKNRKSAEGMLINGVVLLLGVGDLVVDPFKPALVSGELRALPASSAEERRAKLERAEKMLRDCARRETYGRSLTNHLLNIGANAAGAVILKAAFKQSWGDALVNFASGEAVSLLTIFTQPTRATRDLKAYEAKYLGKGGAVLPAPAERKWSLSVGPGGLTFRYEF